MIASNVALIASQGDPHKLIVLLTLMIGVSQCIVAAVRAGTLTRFVSEPVLVGFTAGAGIYIGVNQLPSAMGLGKKDVVASLFGWKPPSDVLFDFCRAIASFGKANFVAIGIVVATIVLVRVFNWLDVKVNRRLPATFLTVVIVSAVAYVLGLGDPAQGHAKLKLVQDIEPVTRNLPQIVWPEMSLDKILGLLAPAFAIGILGAVEAIAIGKALAAEAGHRFDANRQLVGEGACNIGAALVGGFAASGSFSRTAVNYEAGAVTRLSCIFSGVLILGIVFAFAPVANFIPVAVLAGLLIHIGLKLVNIGKVKLLMSSVNRDRTVLWATFIAVLVLPSLSDALFLGVGLSIILALRRAEGFRLRVLQEDAEGNLVEGSIEASPSGGVVALDLQGELFFAAAEELERQLHDLISADTKFIVLRLQQAYNIDTTCVEALRHAGRQAKRAGGQLILSGVRPGTFGLLERSGLVEELGADAVFQAEPTLLGSTRHALALARRLATQAKAPRTEPERVTDLR